MKDIIEKCNTRLDDQFKFNEEELSNFAEENALSLKSKKTIWSFIQYKLISKLIEEKVMMRDMTRITIRKLFKLNSESRESHPSLPILSLEKYNSFLDQMKTLLSPFEEIHPLSMADLMRMREFDTDKNMTDDQFFYATYLRSHQK